MPDITSVNASGSQDINGLLYDWRWAVNTFTFSFPGSASYYEAGAAPNNELSTFSPLNGTQQNQARSALAQYSAVANLNFTEITESAGQHADLRFALTLATQTAWAYLPATEPFGGDSWYRAGSTYANPVRGNYAAHTILHEIGHALGLLHGHDTTNPFGALPSAHDSLEYSVMTYRSYVGAPLTGYTYETWGAPQTLMQDDIAAIQYLYGANYNYNGGNTIYNWNPSTGDMYVDGASQGTPGGNRIFLTVWDGGGRDTYDLSNYTTNLSIDLRPGNWTTVSSAQLANLGNGHIAAGNIANSLFSSNGATNNLIEDAYGGSGNDTIVGNDSPNGLNGLGGSDLLVGLAGADTLAGGAGRDTFQFRAGDGADVIMDFATGAAGDVLRFVNINSASVSMSDQATVIASNFRGQYLGISPTGFGAQGDFNSDGHTDLIWRDNTAFMSMWSLDGVGGHTTTDLQGVGFSWQILTANHFVSESSSQMLARQSGDGTLVLWWVNNGNTLSGINLGALGTNIEIVDTGAFGGAGNASMLVRNNADNHMYLWRVDDSTNTLAGVDLGAAWSNISYLGSGDVTGDGRADMIVRNNLDNHMYVWWVGGNNTLGGIDLGAGFGGISLLNVADLTGDARADMLVRNQATNELYVWTVAGGTLSGINLHSQSNVQVLQTGNFGGDGHSEMLVRNVADNHLYLWWEASGQLQGVDLGAFGGEWSTLRTGNYDGDAFTDVVWRTADGRTAMWNVDNYNYVGSNQQGLTANSAVITYDPGDTVTLFGVASADVQASQFTYVTGAEDPLGGVTAAGSSGAGQTDPIGQVVLEAGHSGDDPTHVDEFNAYIGQNGGVSDSNLSTELMKPDVATGDYGIAAGDHLATELLKPFAAHGDWLIT